MLPLANLANTVEPVYIEHSWEMKKCSMCAGVQCIQVLSNWRLDEIETKSRVIRETWSFHCKIYYVFTSLSSYSWGIYIVSLMLLVANLANTKWCKIPIKWLRPWHIWYSSLVRLILYQLQILNGEWYRLCCWWLICPIRNDAKDLEKLLRPWHMGTHHWKGYILPTTNTEWGIVSFEREYSIDTYAAGG